MNEVSVGETPTEDVPDDRGMFKWRILGDGCVRFSIIKNSSVVGAYHFHNAFPKEAHRP